MLITVSDIGHMTVDVRGPVKDKDGILQILESARELVEQGNFRSGPGRTS
jgi:ribosomal protein S28E/S33